MLKFAKTPSVGLLLLFALAGAAMAEDEFVSWGDVYFHNGTTGKYAVYHDKSSPNYEYYKGPWMRVWYQGNYVLTAGFSSYENGWATLGWYNYFTNGTQWTGNLPGRCRRTEPLELAECREVRFQCTHSWTPEGTLGNGRGWLLQGYLQT